MQCNHKYRTHKPDGTPCTMNRPVEKKLPAVCRMCGHEFPGQALSDGDRDQAVIASICPSKHSPDELRAAFPEAYPS